MIGLCAAAIGLAGIPGDVKQWSEWLTYANHDLIRTALVLLGVSILIALHWPNLLRWPRKAADIPTYLRLQFNMPGTLPVAIDEKNIWRWHALRWDFAYQDTSGKLKTVRTWTLFLLFDRPIAVKQFRIDGGGGQVPSYEIKDYSQRHAIIAFGGDLGGLVLQVQVELLRSSGG